jgi:hypothetical protein
MSSNLYKAGIYAFFLPSIKARRLHSVFYRVPSRHATPRHGTAHHGVASHGVAWRGVAWHSTAPHGMAPSTKVCGASPYTAQDTMGPPAVPAPRWAVCRNPAL